MRILRQFLSIRILITNSDLYVIHLQSQTRLPGSCYTIPSSDLEIVTRLPVVIVLALDCYYQFNVAEHRIICVNPGTVKRPNRLVTFKGRCLGGSLC